YDPASGTWTMTSSLNSARAAHTATLLPNGKVLVAGGFGISNNLVSAELYDPSIGTWEMTGFLSTARTDHTATLLANGKVLVAGGLVDDYVTTNAELYDPASGTWTMTSSLNCARAAHTTTLLPNGKVLVAGGFGISNYLASAELYDPASGIWRSTSGLNTPRGSHTATLLPSGNVLVGGGRGISNILASAELYDIGLGFSTSWRPQIQEIISPLSFGDSLVFFGARLRGVSEGSGSTTQGSPADHPVVQLRSMQSGQTLFLQSEYWSSNLYVSAPVRGLPPGWTLATAFVNGIPSIGGIINISVPVPTPFILAAPKRLSNGAFEFDFANTPGVLGCVLAATNPSLPLTNWTVLGAVTEVFPGQFQFTDSQATNIPRRFYRVCAQ
ncbi:MAG: hypothetical protein NT154_38260, partial [Verrucomicrobia bacterium]|nr:hypothetical protein [Verrucomicrobiota bacterium]